jgi:hypothetical protein
VVDEKMPRAFLVKNKQELCGRSADLRAGDEDENKVEMLKEAKNCHDQKNVVFDVIWKMMNERDDVRGEEERRGDRLARQRIEQFEKINEGRGDLGLAGACIRLDLRSVI